MRYQGRVLADAAARSQVQVELNNLSSCSRCARGGGCGAAVLGAADQPLRIACRTSLPLHAGQRVTVAHDEGDSSWLWLVSGAYGLPLLGMLIAGVAAHLFALNFSQPASVDVASADTMVAMASGIGLLAGLWCWRRLEARVLARVQPRLCLQSLQVVTIDDSPTIVSREISDET